MTSCLFHFLLDLALGSDNTFESIDEPLDGLTLLDALLNSNGANSSLTSAHSVTSTFQDNEDVHTVDTNAGIVLNSEIDVFFNAEAEVAVVSEVLFLLNANITLD